MLEKSPSALDNLGEEVIVVENQISENKKASPTYLYIATGVMKQRLILQK